MLPPQKSLYYRTSEKSENIMAHVVKLTPKQSTLGTMLHQYEIDIYRNKKDNQIAEIDNRSDGFYYYWDHRFQDVYFKIDDAHEAIIRDIVNHLSEYDNSHDVEIEWKSTSMLQKSGTINYTASTL